MPQQWKGWDWNARPNRRSRPQGDRQRKDAAGSTKSLPSYDSTSLPASSSKPSSSSTLSNDKVLELLRKVAEKDESALSEIEKMLPSVVEEDESEQLRQQQKRLNQIRKLQTRLAKKETAVQQKEQQLHAFIQEMRQHVESEKARHKREVEEISKEIEGIKQQLALLKEGKQLPEAMEEDVDEPFTPVDEEKIQLRQQVEQAHKDQETMRQQVAYMKQQMDHLMQQYQEGAVHTRPLEPIPISPQQGVKTPKRNMEESEQAKNTQRDAKAPFGLRMQSKLARDAASPYGPSKGPEGGMD